MTPEELAQKEQEEFNTGPLSVLTQSVKNNTQVLINCRNNKKLLGRVKAFDRRVLQIKLLSYGNGTIRRQIKLQSSRGLVNSRD